MDEWNHLHRDIILSHGLTLAEDAIMGQCHYFTALPKGKLEAYTYDYCSDWPPRDFDASDLTQAIDSLIQRGLLVAVSPGVTVQEVNIFGEAEGLEGIYPEGGFILTDEGWTLFRKVAFATFGQEYFEEERHEHPHGR